MNVLEKSAIGLPDRSFTSWVATTVIRLLYGRVAEESGAILALGRAVLFEACREAAPWRDGTGEGIALTVNLSAAQLGRSVHRRPRRHPAVDRVPGHAPGPRDDRDRDVHGHADDHRPAHGPRDLGVRIAVDDFGTGYSSLGYLRRFTVDMLKIAREFIATSESGLRAGPSPAIVALGRTLGLRIIAEGIEEADQLDQLRDLGCEFGQGYLFARPMAGEEVAERLQPPGALGRRPAGRAARPAGRLMFLLYAVARGSFGVLLGGRLSGLACSRSAGRR